LKGYFLSIKYYFLITVILFLVSVYAGFLLSELLPFSILDLLREIFGETAVLERSQLVIFIFLNNSVKSLVAILLGFIFGLYPILFVMGNGVVLGLVTSEVERIEGAVFTLAAVLPHGIVEIPMILLSAAIGLRMGYTTVKKLEGKGSLKEELKNGLIFFAILILPFLLAAAIIESFITPLVLDMV